jgi:archaellum component FlaC
MIQDIWKVAKSLVTLADKLDKYHTEIEKIREELRDLTIIVHALAQDIRNSKEQAAQRHENLLLEIENRLLKYEKALPPAAKKAAKKRPKR